MASTEQATDEPGDIPQGSGAARPAGEVLVAGLPLILTLLLAVAAFLPRIQAHGSLHLSFILAALLLLLWQAWLYLAGRRHGYLPRYRVVLRRQHYLQALVQLSVFLYWGYFWRPVHDHFWLLIGQIAFAYAFDMLLARSRRREYVLGFGPLPIIFSINLFLWFRDDWFYLQFLMIAIGFMGKEYLRWRRDGRDVHIFNPSALALGLFSLALIATDTTHLTWGQEIASTLTLAPNIYTFLFLIGLVVMYFFAITLVAGAAALALFALSYAYFAATGVPYFVDSDIPAAVFLGLHLLVTDPSTSPRTPAGKVVFGVLYGGGVFALYTLLEALGAPTFYDKLLCVPLLNLSVIGIDRMMRAIRSEYWQQLWKGSWLGGRANLAHMGFWVLSFGALSLAGKTDARHDGDRLPFWENACQLRLAKACERLLSITSNYCRDNSAWACNEAGLHYRRGEAVAANPELALYYFGRACELRLSAGCLNLLDGEARHRVNPRELDLRLLLREGGRNLMSLDLVDLNIRACEHGWEFACEPEGNGRG